MRFLQIYLRAGLPLVINASYLKKEKEKKERDRIMKKFFSRLFYIILIAAFLGGAGLLGYPYVADFINSWQASKAIDQYSESVTSMDNGEYEKIMEQAHAYNQELLTQPDRYNPSEEFHQKYMDTLNVGETGLMGTLTIPKINVKLPIYHTTEENVLQSAAGHIEWTSLPVGGIGTHSVISGHTGLPTARLLTDLDKLELNDLFTLTVLNEKMTYQIDDISVVLPQEAEKLAVNPDKDEVTLLTCTPYGINTHRLLIKGHRIENPEEDYLNKVDQTGRLDIKLILLAGAGLGIIVILILLVRKPKPKKK